MPAAGLFGPLEGIRTYGMSLSAISGLDSLTGYLGGPPVPVENAFADPLGGIVGALGVLLGCTIGPAPATGSTSTSRSKKPSCSSPPRR